MSDIKIKKQNLSYAVIEAYKSIRTNLFFCSRGKKAIAITSCTPNEGKSTVSLNLALSLAEAKKKVIFLDADLRNSALMSKIVFSGGKFGMAHYLSGMVSLEEIICSTDCENLDVVLTGRFPPNPAELLGDQYFKNMINQLKEKYDYIIIDTPPVGSVIDSIVVAEACDGVIFVIENNAISYHFAQQVKEQLEKTGCPILGAILNRVDMAGNGYGRYGKYGGYGRYGQYGQNSKSTVKKTKSQKKR